MSLVGLDETSFNHRPFRQLFELGRGGMARVYLAESLASGIRKLVVLKVLNSEFCASPEMRAFFRREAELAAQMNHPNVVQVMEVVEFSETPVIVMEYLDGVSLSLLRRQGDKGLPLPLHLYVLSQMLAGLHHFHELRDLDGEPLNAVHRDVSPQNVMVLHEGLVKVLDFGIAKINAYSDLVTRNGTIKGKIHYMAPEQVTGDGSVDRRTDIFAVGVMLWEAVAGRRMWRGKSDTEVLQSLAEGALPKLPEPTSEAPNSVLRIVERATQPDRSMRFATAQEMQVALEGVLADERWHVHSSQLAEFMARNFGEMRRIQQLKIKGALRAPLGSTVTATRVPVSAWSDIPRARSESTGPTSQVTLAERSSRLFRAGKRNLRALLAVLGGCFVLSGALLLGRRGPFGRDRSEPRPPGTISFEVEALPVGAEISLDGRLLGTSHVIGQQRSTDQHVVLEVKAPGYVTERKEISLAKDTVLLVMLKPNPFEESPAASGTRVTMPLAEPSSLASSGRPPVVPRVPSKAPKPFTGNAKRCSPPYTFGPDGVKTYKPECF